MQELESLQADLTITLSQMKRTPSRSRLAMLAATDQDADDDADERSKAVKKLHMPDVSVQHLRWQREQSRCEEQQRIPTAQVTSPLAESAQPGTTYSDPTGPGLSGVQAAVLQPEEQLAVGVPDPAPVTQVSKPVGKALAANGDLESLMASLSMKYAAVEQEAVSSGVPSRSVSSGSPTKTTRESSPDLPVVDARPGLPPASDEVGLSADETSLIMKYAARPLAGAGLLPPAAATSPDTKHSRVLSRAAAAGESGPDVAAAPTSTVATDLSQSYASSTATTPGKPRLAAAVAAGLAAWRSAVDMDCPSPLSPASAVSEDLAAGAAVSHVPACINADDSSCSADVSSTPEQASQDPSSTGVGGSSLLTPTTQVAIKHAVQAAGLSTAADRPKSSIRRMQPTTDMSRLEEMRGVLQHQQRGLTDSFDTVYHQQQQRKAPVVNLETRLLAQELPASSDNQSDSSRELQVTEQPGSDLLFCLRKQKEHAAAAVMQKQVEAIEQEEAKLTPRAARLQRRHQVQQEQAQQQERRVEQRRATATVLQSVENTAFAGPHIGQICSSTLILKESAAQNVKSSSKAKDSGSSRDQPASVTLNVKLVSEEEFAGLPGWCRGLLTVEVLNAALEELNLLVSAR